MNFTPKFAALSARRFADLQAELAALLRPGLSIILELGCGHGHFLARYAADFPRKTCVGVDLSSARIDRAVRKAGRAKLAHCHFVRADAADFLRALPAGISFEEIWVLFPDPWPKKRHHKNRLLQPALLEALAARTGAGGRLYFRTDHSEYFAAVPKFFAQTQSWQLNATPDFPVEPETVFQARAPSHHSLVAIRTSHPARPAGTVAPTPPPPAAPKWPA